MVICYRYGNRGDVPGESSGSPCTPATLRAAAPAAGRRAGRAPWRGSFRDLAHVPPARAEWFVVSLVRDDTPIRHGVSLRGGRTGSARARRGGPRRSVVLEWRSTEPRFDGGKLRVRLP